MFKPFLDENKNYAKYDPQSLASSIRLAPHQFEVGQNEATVVSLGFDVSKIKRIIYVGMGGSAMAGKIVSGMLPLVTNLPFEVVENFRLPVWVKRNTLCILVSYSGNTEEVLSCVHDALHHDAKVILISTDGKLMRYAIENHLTFIKIPEETNPSHAPRYGVFLMLGILLNILSRVSSSSIHNIEHVVPTIEKINRLSDIKIPLSQNSAKDLASRYAGTGLILLSANHMTGVAEASLNYFHESSKTFAVSYNSPDIYHHLLDGLSFPKSLPSAMQFLMLESNLYPQIIAKKNEHLKNTITKQGFKLSVVKPESTTGLIEVIESLVFLTWFSYYLSIANRVSPLATPWVDYFKKIN